MENKKNKRVVVGMSGGVDSSVAAALLVEQGYEVVGITMKTYDYSAVGGNVENDTSCCGLNAIQDARLVAAKLGIPHYVVDFSEEFEKTIISNFVDEYLHGRTPNPCVLCNRFIKWGALLRKAEALDASYIATGHYARLRYHAENNRYTVVVGADREKDQSYALWAVTQEALARTLFPLGELTKPEVRALAEKYQLRTAQKGESYEICFVPDNRYDRFLKERIPHLSERVEGGDIVLDGKVVGKHQGYPFYTIGQRRNIGAYGKKMYVTGIDSEKNVIMIGEEKELCHRLLRAASLNWMSRETITEPLRGKAKVRYKDDATPATLFPPENGTVRILFEEPKRAITPGQSMVFYLDDEIVCGGIIETVLKNDA